MNSNFILLILLSVYIIKTDDIPIDISPYEYPKKSDTDAYRIAIMGTNDIHGKIFPVPYDNPIDNTTYESGGAYYLGSYMNILRNEWGNQFLWLDGGDQFEGGMEFDLSNGTIMNTFFNTKKLTASTLGNHEFSYGIDELKAKMNESKFDYLDANIENYTSGESEFLPHQVKSKLYTVDKVKIGIIGLATVYTPSTSSLKPNLIRFLPYKEILMVESKKLKEQGAKAVLLISHFGAVCNNDENLFVNNLRTKDTVQPPCSESEEFNILLNSLPKGYIDGVVAGHVHKINHHWINHIPVIQTNGGVSYTNVMYLAFDPNDNYKLISNKTEIEGPLPACEKIFENTKRCEYMDKNDIAKAGSLKNFKFHNVQMEKDIELIGPLSKWKSIIDQKYQNVYVANEAELKTNSENETTLMNIVNDLGRRVTGADLCLFNLGGFRAIWHPGKISEVDLFNMFPFTNNYVSFVMSGEQVLAALRAVQSTYSILPSSGVTQYFRKSGGKFIFVDGKFFDGIAEKDVILKKEYTVCMNDYLANGGSNFDRKIFSWYKIKNRKDYGSVRNYLTTYLRFIKVIKEGMFIDKNHPRVKYLN